MSYTHNNKKSHTYHGYEHNEKGDRKLTVREVKMIDRIKKGGTISSTGHGSGGQRRKMRKSLCKSVCLHGVLGILFLYEFTADENRRRFFMQKGRRNAYDEMCVNAEPTPHPERIKAYKDVDFFGKSGTIKKLEKNL